MMKGRGKSGRTEQEKGQLEGTDVKVSFRSGTPELRDKYTGMGVVVLLQQPQS